METIDPETLLNEGDDFAGNLRLSYGDNGETFRRALTLAGRSGGLTVLGSAKRATGEDHTTGNGDGMGGTAADLDSYFGTLTYEAATGHRVEFSAQGMTDGALRQFRAGFGGDDRNLRRYETRRRSYSLRYDNTNATGLWDPSATFGYSRSDIIVPEPHDSNCLT